MDGQKIRVYDEYIVSRHIVLRYIAVCTPDFLNSSAEDSNIYSALIILEEDGTSTETKFIYDIVRSEEESHRIMRLLSENGVTPGTAEDIITEIL